jgi:hypothetical protein
MEADRGRACSSSTGLVGPFADGPASIDREVDAVIAIRSGRQRPHRRTAHEAAMFLRRIDREHAVAMYRWSHPHNIAWALATGRRVARGCELYAEGKR